MEKIKIGLPTTIVVFGARGDLSKRKLFPAFFDLYSKDVLPDDFKILGVGRTEVSNEEFKSTIKDSIKENYKGDAPERFVDEFTGYANYISGLFEEMDTYKRMSEELLAQDEKLKLCSNKLFYLAVPPKYYKTILANLEKSGLTIPCSKEEGWTRVLIEKPFGSDYETAHELDKLLGDLFHEEQIFRIDHYLAKDTIQNILTFRFTNALFEPVWNNEHIEKVEIKLLEKADVSGRGDFYDGIGALRDVGQNHVLQMLASIAMENPKELISKNIREKRAELLSFLEIIKDEEMDKFAQKGQYEGYRNEKGIDQNSKTETYFKIKANIKNNRWEGVPFILESGKALAENKTEIKIYFKEQKPCFCVDAHEGHKHQNVMTFKIQPDASITISFFVKKPTLKMDYTEKDLSFKYGGNELGEVLHDAYEKILYDCMTGDQTLFPSTQEILASWKFISSILSEWQEKEPKIYKKGSEGPLNN